MKSQNPLSISKWSKAVLLQEIGQMNLAELDMEKIQKVSAAVLKECLTECESDGRTKRYVLDSDKLLSLAANGYEQVSEAAEAEDAAEAEETDKGVCGSYRVVTARQGRKKMEYTESWVPFEHAAIEGDWVVFENGLRKKLSNVKLTSR